MSLDVYNNQKYSFEALFKLYQGSKRTSMQEYCSDKSSLAADPGSF